MRNAMASVTTMAIPVEIKLSMSRLQNEEPQTWIAGWVPGAVSAACKPIIALLPPALPYPQVRVGRQPCPAAPPIQPVGRRGTPQQFPAGREPSTDRD